MILLNPSKKAIIALIMFLIVGLMSCNKSNSSSSNSQIIGMWVCHNHYYGGDDTYIFNSNDTYKWIGPDTWDVKTGYYSYNPATSILTISPNNGTTRVYSILSLTSSNFVMMDEDGDCYTYYKN